MLAIKKTTTFFNRYTLIGIFIGFFASIFSFIPFILPRSVSYPSYNSVQQKKFMDQMEAQFALKFKTRLDNLFNGAINQIRPWDIFTEVYLWDWFPPLAPCLYRERIGILGDGGKWICDLARYASPRPKPCVIYSFGVRGDSSFEAEMHERTSCEIFGFDFSVDGMAGAAAGMKRVHFQKVGLGVNESPTLMTLKQIMAQHSHSFIDVLKIDIEGAEFEVLPSLMAAFSVGNFPVEQLLIEVHHETGKTPQLFDIMLNLRVHGFVAFSHEINFNPPSRGLPADVIEISLYNVNSWW